MPKRFGQRFRGEIGFPKQRLEIQKFRSLDWYSKNIATFKYFWFLLLNKWDHYSDHAQCLSFGLQGVYWIYLLSQANVVVSLVCWHGCVLAELANKLILEMQPQWSSYRIFLIQGPPLNNTRILIIPTHLCNVTFDN